MEKERNHTRKAPGNYVNIAFSTALQQESGRTRQVRIKTRIHYREKGEGPCLLLLHDVGQSSDVFRRISTHLAKRYRVIMPDLPGHGASGCPDMDYTVDDFSLFIESFVKTMGLSRIAIGAVGQSAAYAIDYCQYAEGNVEALVLLNPGALTDIPFGSSKYLTGILGKFLLRRFANPTYMRKQIEKGFFDKTALKEQEVRAYCRPFEKPPVQRCVQSAILNFDDTAALEAFGTLEVPALFLQGGEDTLSNEAILQTYLQAAVQPYSLVIRNCGAWMYQEKSEQTAEGMVRFLRGDTL